ncbi:diguanylate phosphodiesterase [Terrihabitans soli]|uniref:Diguanylate phosphodiesterase n=1 Tax=Terrihabitans soli TaxID=708113 RepID=A0A6S6QPW0_9HYPH|nr:EAL domain-containing protein [Terrihabitans soli]BCJ91536.1 diguanylate phosphodiesterase [Terrihabitans soli]
MVQFPQTSSAPTPGGPAAHRQLCYILDNDAPVRRIISFGAARKNFRSVECPSLGALIERTVAERPDLIFIDIEGADSDAVEALRHLEKANYDGVVHLMSRREPALLETLAEIGVTRGLVMGHRLHKPFRRSAIETIFEETSRGTPLPMVGASAPPIVAPDSVTGATLHDAVTTGAVALTYQPRFDLETGRPYGAEAFARHRVSFDLLSASRASAAPEDLDRLTEIMLTSAMGDWRRFARPSFNPLITLRVPLVSLARLPIGEIIRRGRPQTSDWPGLVIELTEAEVTGDPQRIREIAAQMKIYGLGVSIGDFGTGRTTLSALGSVAPNEMTIDPSFVRSCATRVFNSRICNSLVLLARSLGARSVAEGVGSDEDLMALIKLGCDAAQGDFLARPLLAEDFERFLARGDFLDLPEVRTSNLLHLRQHDARLSLREIEVLEHIAMGKSSKETGQALGLSPRTIDVYRAKLMAKLNARNVAELVKVALTARH